MRASRAIFLGLASTVLAVQASAADKFQVDVCNARGLIETTLGEDGPLKGCNAGDTVHFQIDTSRVAYSSIVARYCDLNSSVVIEQHPDPKVQLAHVVCRYQWKWSKDVIRQKRPDQK